MNPISSEIGITYFEAISASCVWSVRKEIASLRSKLSLLRQPKRARVPHVRAKWNAKSVWIVCIYENFLFFLRKDFAKTRKEKQNINCVILNISFNDKYYLFTFLNNEVMKVFCFLKRKSRVKFSLPTPLELLTNTALMLHGLTLREPFSSNDDYKYFLRQAMKNINAILSMYKTDTEEE